MIEREAGGFCSIPVGIYWANVTITSVGYGDVAPITPMGRLAASAVMLLVYSIIAAEIGEAARRGRRAPRPPGWSSGSCGESEHLPQARNRNPCGSCRQDADHGNLAIT